MQYTVLVMGLKNCWGFFHRMKKLVLKELSGPG
jgi:hypothetical protein